LRFDLETRYPDYDTKGHVNNAVYLTYFEVARNRVWVAMGGGADFGFVVAEATVRYMSQARIGDPLDIEIRTSDVRNKAWVWTYRITNTHSNALVAEGSTVQVMYDYEARQSIPVPDALRGQLSDL